MRGCEGGSGQWAGKSQIGGTHGAFLHIGTDERVEDVLIALLERCEEGVLLEVTGDAPAGHRIRISSHPRSSSVASARGSPEAREGTLYLDLLGAEVGGELAACEPRRSVRLHDGRARERGEGAGGGRLCGGSRRGEQGAVAETG